MAIGVVVAIREAIDSRSSSSRWVNGDRGTILEHLSDGVMRIRRDREGVVDVSDTNERAASNSAAL